MVHCTCVSQRAVFVLRQKQAAKSILLDAGYVCQNLYNESFYSRVRAFRLAEIRARTSAQPMCNRGGTEHATHVESC
jgi:hypothetical protein